MKKRGRKSANELLVAAPSVEAVLRPDAPYDLTDEQADEWRAIVEAMPADWFPRPQEPVQNLFKKASARSKSLLF